jgi:hypothetical protein
MRLRSAFIPSPAALKQAEKQAVCKGHPWRIVWVKKPFCARNGCGGCRTALNGSFDRHSDPLARALQRRVGNGLRNQANSAYSKIKRPQLRNF